MDFTNQHNGSQEKYLTLLIQIFQMVVHISGRCVVSEFVVGRVGSGHGRTSGEGKGVGGVPLR